VTPNQFDDTDSPPPLFSPSRPDMGDFGRRRATLDLPPLPSKAERIGLTAFIDARKQAQGIFAAMGTRPKLLSFGHFSAVGNDIAYAVRLMRQEKEIFLFAALQWLVIGVAYFMWVQVIDWIPDSVWAEVQRALKEDREAQNTAASLALWGWSLLIIATAAYPLALFNASITAAHYLRVSHQPSTIGACLNLAFKNIGRLWLFTALDGVVTLNAIVDRLPKKRGRRTALEEAAYYAWKIATAGVLPSLVAGNNFAMAAKESVRLLEDQPVRTISIRMAYSFLCWIVGVTAYVGAFFFLVTSGAPMAGENWLYHIYLLLGAPIFFAVGVMSLLRPVFVIAISKLYTDVIPVDVEDKMSVADAETVVDIPVIIFVTLLCFLLTLYVSS